MAGRRYRQNCALARAADVIGDRWTLLLLRDLLISARRFNELLASQRGIGTNLLASRLKDLQAAGLVRHNESQRLYELTDRGRALESAILALIRWGLSHGPENQADDHHCDDWDLLALKSLFQPQRAADLDIAVQFGTENFCGWARISQLTMAVGLGQYDAPTIVVDGSVKSLFIEADEPAELLAAGEPDSLARFMQAFALRP